MKYFDKDSNEGSNKDSNESSTIHMHGDNILIFIGYETNNIIEELFNSVIDEYQENLKTKIKKRLCF